MTEPLARPIWHALNGRQAALAVGDERARRFRCDISPFVACADDSAETLAGIARLLPDKGVLLFLQAGEPPLPPGCREVERGLGVQMVAKGFDPVARPEGVEPLAETDWPAMLALAKSTRPGPFRERTPSFGQFWGVKDADGSLLAMAGERLKIEGMTEVSGVCTHPDARGRGLAGLLSAHVASEIARRGETPFLHAYADNSAAIRLYERLGFVLTREVGALVVTRA